MVDITLLDEALHLVATRLHVAKLATMCLVNRELHTAFAEASRSRQRDLLKQLDQAEDGGRWAWIHPPKWKCFYECDKTQCTLARLMVRDGESSVFRDFNSFIEFQPRHHGTYLLRDDQVRIRWVGVGKNAGGGWLDGEELEHDVVYHMGGAVHVSNSVHNAGHF
jgi:hypothetical protein